MKDFQRSFDVAFATPRISSHNALKDQCPRFGIYFGFSFLPCSVPVRVKHMELNKQMGRRQIKKSEASIRHDLFMPVAAWSHPKLIITIWGLETIISDTERSVPRCAKKAFVMREVRKTQNWC